MTFEEWRGQFPLGTWEAWRAAFQAGVASRDTEVERLRGKLSTIEILTQGSRDVAGLHYLSESALADRERF